MRILLASIALLAGASSASAVIYAGASAGRYLDQKETYYAARLGFELLDTAVITHNAELEYLIWDKDQDLLGPGRATGDVMAFMANYRAIGTILPILRVSGGAGAGQGKIKLSGPGSGATPISDKDSKFAWQVFAAVHYTVAPRVDITLGARHFEFEAEIFGRKDLVGGDTGIELGVNVRL